VRAIHAPITGNVWQLLAAVGDAVREGDVVAIVESMKLEIPIEAEADGTIREVLVAVGELVTDGQPMFAVD
jgi:biotin carboxyl carrier protein